MVFLSDRSRLDLEIYGNRSLPKITFVIIKKSHNTRFFASNGQSISNMAAGTVIDTTIVHPRQFDFYLNSHAGALGTNVCSYYHVLYNEIEFTSDELQQLTFWVSRLMHRYTSSLSFSSATRMSVARRQSNVQLQHATRILWPTMRDTSTRNRTNRIRPIVIRHR